MMRVPNTITAPSALTFTFRAGRSGVDLTTVTAGSLAVLRRDGTTATWALTIVSQTPGELVAQYVFTGGAEIAGNGVYYLAPTLTVPGGVLPCDAVAMFVTPPTNCSPQVEAVIDLNVSVLVNTGWRVPQSGVTASRPTAGVAVGYCYFDTTLGYPVFWKGAVWVNGAGSTV